MIEEIKIVFSPENNESTALFEGNIIGECQFEVEDNKWIIVHTGVRPEFGGRGIAKELVKRVIEEARNRNIKIVPVCSYAQKLMLNNEEYKDVLIA